MNIPVERSPFLVPFVAKATTSANSETPSASHRRPWGLAQRTRRNPSAYLVAVTLVAAFLLIIANACTPAATPTPAATKAAPAPAATQPKPAATAAAPSTQPAKPAEATKPASAKEPAKEAVKPLAPPVNVKFGTLKIGGDAGLFIALDRGYFKEEGIDLELVPFRSAADAIAPLSTGELDFGAGSINPGYFNAIQRGLDLKIVAEKVTTNNFTDSGIVVRKDLWDSGEIKSLAQLKGKKVAVNLRANSSEMYVDMALRQAGLTIDDVEAITMPFPDMATALGNRALDAAYIVEPFVALGKLRGFSELLMDTTKIYPGEVAMAMIASPVLAQKNPEVVRRVVTAHLRGQRDYYDAFVNNKADKEPIYNILAKYTGNDDIALQRQMMPHWVDPNGAVDPNIIAKDQDYFVSRGWIKDKVDVSKLVDMQYINYALQRLGRYQ